MPLYQFCCSKCEYEEDTILPVKDRDLERICPKCETVLTKKINVPNLHGILNPDLRDLDNQTKNELAKELKEFDQHRKDDDNRVKAMIRDGRYVE